MHQPFCFDKTSTLTYNKGTKHICLMREEVDIEESIVSNIEEPESYRVPQPGRFDLIPPVFMEQLAQVYEEGVISYGAVAYLERQLPYSVIMNHLLRHLYKYWSGDRSELHMAKVAWGAATIITLDDYNGGEGKFNNLSKHSIKTSKTHNITKQVENDTSK